jgi:PPK2 family polyphosphate:nucleotide phosphotransferase
MLSSSCASQEIKMIKKKYIDLFHVDPEKKIRLKDFDTGWTQSDEFKGFGKDKLKERATEVLEQNRADLNEVQELLYADDRYSVLIVFQAMDAAGKDGTIKHVMSGINPQGCHVVSFKKPSTEDLDHNFLWRCMKSLPERGKIGIFNRSYYEDVLIVKVHPELLQQLPEGKINKKFWENRYEDINAFERHLSRNGTVILKFFLNISKETQKERFMERLDRPEKNWKFSVSDLGEREYWDDYMGVYEDAINATSTKWAPWYIIPADNKWVTRALVADIITSTLRELDLKFPEVSEAELKRLAEARTKLENE